MSTEIKHAVNASDTSAQYDEKAKRLLGNKFILAHILVKTIDEFRGMEPKDVVSYIEGEPFIGTVPVEPGLTNKEKEKDGQRVVVLNTENAEINEGLVRFDIIFYVRRLVSSQKGRDFARTDYDDIKRVFSIWVCMNMEENIMNYVHLTDDKLLGAYQWKGGLNLLNIVLIGMSNELPKHDEKYELHRLLSTLFSTELSTTEKLGIMETEYRIPVDDRMREDVNEMCNLSQGIFERGEAKGMVKGKIEIILNMHKKGFSTEQIAEVAEMSPNEVDAIIKGKELALV